LALDGRFSGCHGGLGVQQSEASQTKRIAAKCVQGKKKMKSEKKAVKEYEATRQGKAELKSFFVLSFHTLPGMRAG